MADDFGEGFPNVARKLIGGNAGQVAAIGANEALLDGGRADQLECCEMETFPGSDHERLA
jgi:hypothetical protein